MDEAVDRLTNLEPGSVFADYRVDAVVDRGGMGVVYRATDEDLNRTVALKIIAPEHTKNPDGQRVIDAMGFEGYGFYFSLLELCGRH